jgi:hypothetical protein
MRLFPAHVMVVESFHREQAGGMSILKCDGSLADVRDLEPESIGQGPYS